MIGVINVLGVCAWAALIGADSYQLGAHNAPWWEIALDVLGFAFSLLGVWCRK